jgi:integral membrane protein (TIGR00529 family)
VYHTIAVTLSFLLVVVLLRLRWKVGRALLLSVGLLAVFLPVLPSQLRDFLVANWAEREWHRTFPVQTVDLVVLVILVNFLGEAMKEFGLSARLPGSLQHLMRSRRLALASMPAMMGLMPTPGGIMLSAPLVRDAAAEYGVEPARAATINYWFRHVWEYTFPLFPALPLMSGIVGAPIGTVIFRNFHVTLASLFFGALILLWRCPRKEPRETAEEPAEEPRSVRGSLRDVYAALWPVLLALGLCTAVRLPAGVALAVSVFLLALARRLKPRRIARMLKESFEVDLILVVLAAMSYRAVLDASGAANSVSDVVTVLGLPVPVLVFVLPLFMGVITGVSSATMGLSCPLLVSFLAPGGEVKYQLMTLALFGGMTGVLMTPVHLCLALSKKYFDVKFSQIYKYTVPLAATTAIVVFVVAIFWKTG